MGGSFANGVGQGRTEGIESQEEEGPEGDWNQRGSKSRNKKNGETKRLLGWPERLQNHLVRPGKPGSPHFSLATSRTFDWCFYHHLCFSFIKTKGKVFFSEWLLILRLSPSTQCAGILKTDHSCPVTDKQDFFPYCCTSWFWEGTTHAEDMSPGRSGGFWTVFGVSRIAWSRAIHIC